MASTRWGIARVEIRALWPDILKLLQEGNSKSEIYRKLKSENNLSINLCAFVRNLSKILKSNDLSKIDISETSSQKSVVTASPPPPPPSAIGRTHKDKDTRHTVVTGSVPAAGTAVIDAVGVGAANGRAGQGEGSCTFVQRGPAYDPWQEE